MHTSVIKLWQRIARFIGSSVCCFFIPQLPRILKTFNIMILGWMVVCNHWLIAVLILAGRFIMWELIENYFHILVLDAKDSIVLHWFQCLHPYACCSMLHDNYIHYAQVKGFSNFVFHEWMVSESCLNIKHHRQQDLL